MRKDTPAQRFRELYREANALAREREQLEERVNTIRGEIRDLEDRAARIARAEIGFDEDDLVVNEMGVVYRLDSVGPKSLNWTFDRHNSVSTLSEATSDFCIRGIALHKNGLPRWKEGRGIRSKLKKYDPEAGE